MARPFQLYVNILLYWLIILSKIVSCVKTASYTFENSANFPIDLLQSITFTFSAVSNESYFIFIIGDEKRCAITEYGKKCVGRCIEENLCHSVDESRKLYSYTYKPKGSDYGKQLIVKYCETSNTCMEGDPVFIFKETIKLRSVPDKIEMKFIPIKSTNYQEQMEAGRLKIQDHLKIECTSDGALPPSNITFSFECKPRNIAYVEYKRLNAANKEISLGQYFDLLGSNQKPSLESLAKHIADIESEEIMSAVSKKEGPKATQVSLVSSKMMHDCEAVCRQMGKEQRRLITVEHVTDNAFILPRPENGFVRAGDTLVCHADGYPATSIEMDCLSPVGNPLKLTNAEFESIRKTNNLPRSFKEEGIIVTERSRETRVYRSRKKESVDRVIEKITDLRAKNEDVMYLPLSRTESDISKQFKIKGSQITIAPNATVGLELVVVCYAGKVEANLRFYIAPRHYQYNASLGVVLGICAGLLLLSVIIISVMVITKRRQQRANDAVQIRGGDVGVNDVHDMNSHGKVVGEKISREYNQEVRGKNNYQYNQQQSPARPEQENLLLRDTTDLRSSSPRHKMPPIESVYGNVGTFGKTTPHDLISQNEDNASLNYATLKFDGQPNSMREFAASTSPMSHSMSVQNTLAGSSTVGRNRSNQSPAHTMSLEGKPVDDPEASEYTEVVAVMKPKESLSHIVDEQRYEATQTLLAMQRNSDRAYI